MASRSRGSALLLVDLGLWIGGLIVGFILVVVGAAAGSTLLARLGFLVMTAGMLGSAMVRMRAIRGTDGARASAVISVGFRVAAALLFLYLALNFVLTTKTQP